MNISDIFQAKNKFADTGFMQIKMKAQKLKGTRDYSFLLSDDAELPAPTKEPPARNMRAPQSGVLVLCYFNCLLVFEAQKLSFFIENTHTGFLLMFKRQDLLTLSRRANNYQAILADRFTVAGKKGSQL